VFNRHCVVQSACVVQSVCTVAETDERGGDVSDDLAPPLREHPVLGVEVREGAVIVRLAGELDLYNAEVLRAALAEAIATAPKRIVIDMTAVGFVDSTALGVLIEARSRLAEDALLLAAPQRETRRTLQVSGLDRHLPVHDSVDDALTA
jgi:anti-anti-sigma factor